MFNMMLFENYFLTCDLEEERKKVPRKNDGNMVF